MNFILNHFKKLDRSLILACVFLTLIGIISIYSSSFRNGDFLNFKKQIIFLLVGLLIMFVISFFDYGIFKNNPYLILIFYFFLLLLLAGALFFAPEIRGAKAWFKFGKISLQPIEFVKIALIVLFAKYFSMRHIEMYKLSHILLSGFYLILPVILVFFQSDLGSALILVLIWLGILIVSGIKLRHFLLLSLCFLLILISGWNFLLKDYQKARLTSFFVNPDPLGTSWSQKQAKIAIGSGGFLGKGLKKGSQVQFMFLPEPQTDFIFAAIGEEMGFLTISFLFLLFFIILFKAIKICQSSKFNFPKLLVSGITTLWMAQIFVNIGMNIGISPIIGIPLPFVSYGGSALICNYFLLGLLLNVNIKNKT